MIEAPATLTPFDHLVAAVVGVILPLGGALPHLLRRTGTAAAPMSTEDKLLLYWSNGLGLLGLAGGVVFLWSRSGRGPGELGVTAPPGRVVVGVVLGLLFLALFALDTWWEISSPERLATTRARWRRDTPFLPENAHELRHSMVLMGSAAVGEEILFRGYLILYLAHFTGTTTPGLAAAVALPALVFAVAHAYQRLPAVLKIAALSCIFGAIFVITGSLWIPVALHFVVDLVGALLGPRLLPPDGMVAEPRVESRDLGRDSTP